MVFGCVQGQKVPKPAFVRRQIQELGIGTFRNIATVQQTATLYDALSIFVERRVSALPVVDERGMLLKIQKYQKSSNSSTDITASNNLFPQARWWHSTRDLM